MYNQVRTINCSRFYALKDDDGNRINVNVENPIFDKILSLCLDELSDMFSNEGKLEYYIDKYINVAMENVVNIAYDIKRTIKNNDADKELKLKILQSKIVKLLNLNIAYNKYMKKVDIDNGIGEIIRRCLDNSLIEDVKSEEKQVRKY